MASERIDGALALLKKELVSWWFVSDKYMYSSFFFLDIKIKNCYCLYLVLIVLVYLITERNEKPRRCHYETVDWPNQYPQSNEWVLGEIQPQQKSQSMFPDFQEMQHGLASVGLQRQSPFSNLRRGEQCLLSGSSVGCHDSTGSWTHGESVPRDPDDKHQTMEVLSGGWGFYLVRFLRPGGRCMKHRSNGAVPDSSGVIDSNSGLLNSFSESFRTTDNATDLTPHR